MASITYAAAAQTPGVGERIDAYSALLEDALEERDVQGALHTYVQNAVLDRVNSTGAGAIVGRQCLVLLGERMRAAHADTHHPLASTPLFITMLHDVLDATDASALWADELAELRWMLADAYESQERWADAARALQGIAMDTNRRNKSDAYWLRLNVRLLRLWLQAEDSARAELYWKRASALVHTMPSAARGDAVSHQDAELLLQFRQGQAELYDRQHRFMEAAKRYHELSTETSFDEPRRTLFLYVAPLTQNPCRGRECAGTQQCPAPTPAHRARARPTHAFAALGFPA